MAMQTDLSLQQGSTFVLEFQIFNDQLEPLDILNSSINSDGVIQYSLDNHTMRMNIKKSKYRNPVLLTLGTTSTYAFQPGDTSGFVQDGFFFLSSNTGSVRLVLSADTTSTFKPGRYFYDMELVEGVSGGELVSKILSGKIEIEAESTR